MRDLLCELGHQFSTAMRTCYYWRSGATCRLLPCRRRPRSLLTARTPSRKNIPLSLFRRTARVYIALDRDATDRAIALARTFGTRGRVLIPPEDLGPKGDLNDWLRVGAKGDPAEFRSILERRLRRAPRPGPSRSNGYHRTWHRGIWMTIPWCAISCASSAIRGR